jgi:hypothetical protein
LSKYRYQQLDEGAYCYPGAASGDYVERPKIRDKHGPEYGIQRDIVIYLKARGWHVERLVGDAFQRGLPDLLVVHPKFGLRFVEVKNDGEYNFTKAQKQKFPVLDKYGLGIWILVGADEKNYDKLFAPPNWKDYWKASWGEVDIDALLDELEE